MASAPQAPHDYSPTSASSRRFADRDRFASWNGTAPLDASSGAQQRHRLSRAGNRRIEQTLHIMAVVQLRNRTEGRAYFDTKKAAGKTSMEAMRALNGDCPKSSTPECFKTTDNGRWQAREGTRGRLCGARSPKPACRARLHSSGEFWPDSRRLKWTLFDNEIRLATNEYTNR
jgi:hypothetical protein